MKVGTEVHYDTGRGRQGFGVIVAVHATNKGAFYEVKPADGSSDLKLRAAHLTACTP